MITAQHIYMQTSAELELYGVDWDAPLPAADEDIQIVSVPTVNNPLSEEEYSELQATLPPNVQDSDYGLTQYFLRFVQLRVAGSA